MTKEADLKLCILNQYVLEKQKGNCGLSFILYISHKFIPDSILQMVYLTIIVSMYPSVITSLALIIKLNAVKFSRLQSETTCRELTCNDQLKYGWI